MCVSSRADSSSEHKGSQPPITRGRAETLYPGLLVLSSPGGQKALELLCQPGKGRGTRKCVAAPKHTQKKKTKTQETRETEREREKTHTKPPANRTPKPKKNRATAERERRNAKRQSAGRNNARQILVGRSKAPQRFERKAAPKNKRKTTFPL